MLERVTHPADPALGALSALLERALADPDTLLGADRLRELVAETAHDREFVVLVARLGDAVVGGTVFSYVPATNCGFSEYIVASPERRGAGLGRRLFDARKALLDARAKMSGHLACRGLFIEVDSPLRTPSAFLEAEQATALDARERLRIFDHLGFRRVDIRYVQPPLGRHKPAVTYLDLLFAPWGAQADPLLVSEGTVPAAWVLLTVEPIWRAWAPAAVADGLAALRAQIGDGRVALRAV